MTGAYVRVRREGQWVNLEVEYLTDGEREEFFAKKTSEEVLRWLFMALDTLQNIQLVEPPDETSRSN